MIRILRLSGAILVVLALLIGGVAPVLAADQADLQATSIGVTTLYAGVNNTVTVNVSNNTTTAASGFSVSLQAGIKVIGTVTNLSILGKDNAYYWPLAVTFSWNPAAAGHYTLKAVVTDVTGETITNNNSVSKVVTVLAKKAANINVNVRVEGKTSTLWSGQATFASSTITDDNGTATTVDHPTALGALDAAANAGGFTYDVNSDYGLLGFIKKVGDDANQGSDGWMYLVNWLSPSIAAVDYSLANGDSIVWYYGGYSAKPLQLSVDKTGLLPTDNFTATVQGTDGYGGWSAVTDATVEAASQSYTTDADGKVDISISSLPSGSYSVSASKGDYDSFIRSNAVNVVVVADAPTLASISPSSGSTAGKTQVTMTGTGFVSDNTTVTIGGMAATGVTFKSTTSITATTPAGKAGAKDVVVTTALGSATLTGGFTYKAASSGGGGGGSGGSKSSVSTAITGVGSISVGSITNIAGTFTQTATLHSSDDNATVSIAAGTMGTLKGLPLSTITVTPQSAPPAPPAGSNIVGAAYDLGPNGTTFNPPITLAVHYDPANLSAGVSETSLVLAYFDNATGQWVTITGGAVDTVKHIITVPVSHFTVFSVMAPAPESTPTPAEVTTPSPTPITTLTATPTPMPTATPIPSVTPTTPAASPLNEIVPTPAQASSTAPAALSSKAASWWILAVIGIVVVLAIVMIILRARKTKV